MVRMMLVVWYCVAWYVTWYDMMWYIVWFDVVPYIVVTINFTFCSSFICVKTQNDL
jgi:hypothetical protein